MMPSRAGPAVLLAVLAGCLSDPAPASGRDGGPADAGGGGDGGGAACQPVGAGVNFPPEEGSYTFYPARVADLNCDGKDDLVLLARADDAPSEAGQGVYILFGRAAGFGQVYDARVVTGALEPHAVVLRQLGGDERLDALVYAARDDDGDPADNESVHLAAYEGGPGGFTARGQRQLTTVDALPTPYFQDSSAAFLEPADLDGDDAVNLVLSSGTTLSLLELAPWGSPDPVAEESAVEDLGWFGGPLRVYPRPGGSGDDLVVCNLYDVRQCRHKAASLGLTCSAEASVNDVLPGGIAPYGVFTDLSGDGVPDVIGGSGVDDSVGLVGARMGPSEATVLTWAVDGQSTPRPPVDRVAWSVVANFDGGAAPELVVLDNGQADERSTEIVVYSDLRLSGDTITAAGATRCHTFAEPVATPDFLVDGDFDGDGRRDLVAFDFDGSFVVLDLAADTAPCP